MNDKAPFIERFLNLPPDIDHFVYEGNKVFATAIITVNRGFDLKVRFVRANKRPKQALLINAVDCRLQFPDETLEQARLWYGRGPNPQLLKFTDVGDNAKIFVYNGWEESKGRAMSCVGNYGMTIDNLTKGDAQRFLLHCSDGVGEPDFDSLVVELMQVESGPANPA